MADTVSRQADDANSGLSFLPKIRYPNIQEHLKGCSKKASVKKATNISSNRAFMMYMLVLNQD